ncbi:toll-like receptor 10 isoform X1 [Vombatus ursinus]|uniref:Toll like receptor 10 n=2 Tax=Vombatus ursinus TaxID=29139 RepID=A0A4X2K800_VOMUR|nr:toll-like receptor 10 isoform X1 [Vombatus ursinus]XP_027692013.1 toll-like receptor 10 isoform X1 [Vombatus ursinus]XP_027692014.1 toll-like receptor 10 isoform X1 [Vombatus ursinus]
MGIMRNIYILYSIVLSVLCGALLLPEANEIITDCSQDYLKNVLMDMSPKTTTMDLSHKFTCQPQNLDLSPFSKLKVLILSHNRIQHLDMSIFQFNKELEYLDLSYNCLRNISCYSLLALKHLDLSFNDFNNIPICQEFGSMSQLEFLGLSGTQIRKSDLQTVAHLSLSTIFLGLKHLSYYEEGSLPLLNTERLHIVLPENADYRFILHNGIHTSKTLEMTNINMDQFTSQESQKNPLLESPTGSKTSHLLLRNVDVPWQEFFQILQFIWHSSIQQLQIQNLTIGAQSEFKFKPFNYSNTLMKALKVEHVTVKIYSFPQDIIYLFLTHMDIENLTISGAGMPHIIFPNYPTKFQHLNFANNSLTDELFVNTLQLPHLKTFVLQRNKLEILSTVSSFATKTSLVYLDLSQNLLQYADGKDCYWPETLTTLNLSSNKFIDSVFKCVPKSIQVLDLHNNDIRTIPREIADLKALRELNIASNSLTDLPGCDNFQRLSVLNIEMNSIISPSLDFFQTCQEVQSLKAGGNPFRCTCDLRNFINLGKKSQGLMIGWPDAYTCEYPLELKGIPLENVDLPEISCNTPLLIAVILIVGLIWTVVIAVLCIRFDLPWYLRMIAQWTQTQYRVRNVPLEELKRTIQFHAFISYSEGDSLWVKNELIPNLEKEDTSILICLHERHFIPGKSVVENIINCIEKSYKSIFILSPNFVQSEWCHYELYFAHHKLFHEGSNNLILILLEPIPQYSIPTRYHKLKALMAQRTYLEWPKEKNKHGLFWANLRAAININLSESGKMNKSQTMSELLKES